MKVPPGDLTWKRDMEDVPFFPDRPNRGSFRRFAGLFFFRGQGAIFSLPPISRSSCSPASRFSLACTAGHSFPTSCGPSDAAGAQRKSCSLCAWPILWLLEATLPQTSRKLPPTNQVVHLGVPFHGIAWGRVNQQPSVEGSPILWGEPFLPASNLLALCLDKPRISPEQGLPEGFTDGNPKMACPGKWKHGSLRSDSCWFDFDPHPDDKPLPISRSPQTLEVMIHSSANPPPLPVSPT